LIDEVYSECSGDLIIPEYLQYLKSPILINKEISNFSNYELEKIDKDLQILYTSEGQQELYDKLRDEKLNKIEKLLENKELSDVFFTPLHI